MTYYCILYFRETSQQRLTGCLKLTPVYNFNSSLNTCTSLLELFISSTGGHEARKSFARVTCSETAMAHWHLSLLPLLNHLRHIMYPFFELKLYARLALKTNTESEWANGISSRNLLRKRVLFPFLSYPFLSYPFPVEVNIHRYTSASVSRSLSKAYVCM